LGAKVACRVVDVRDRDAVAAWIEQIEQKMPLDLMIVNAGTFSGRTEAGAFESLAQGQTQIEVNLIGAMNTLYLAAERMKLRRQGRIALVSSLAAILPLADAPGYSASKAGLSAFGKALREDLKPHGVGVSVIHPGHIRTDQTIRHQGKVRLALSPEDAAGRIVRGLASNRAEIAFPIAASIWVHLVSMLPWRLRAWLNRSDRFTVSAPDTTT
jgi:short-subunit dehydrogenase